MQSDSDIHVVIDILRASSTMITLLASGASVVKTYQNFEKAFDEYAKNMSPEILLIGEREGKKIPNFHFGNSPVNIFAHRERIRNKTILFSTTNGTRLLEKLKSGKQVVVGSFLNVRTVVEAILKQKTEKIFLNCAGSRGIVSLEDVLFAGFFIRLLLSFGENIKLYDGAKMALAIWKYNREQFKSDEQTIRETAGNSAHAKYLKKIGFEKDLDFCFSIDKFKLLAVYDQKMEGIVAKYHE
jgi:2-phosphosulfolactate phosphatase